jgi:hypothetical protein
MTSTPTSKRKYQVSPHPKKSMQSGKKDESLDESWEDENDSQILFISDNQNEKSLTDDSKGKGKESEKSDEGGTPKDQKPTDPPTPTPNNPPPSNGSVHLGHGNDGNHSADPVASENTNKILNRSLVEKALTQDSIGYDIDPLTEKLINEEFPMSRSAYKDLLAVYEWPNELKPTRTVANDVAKICFSLTQKIRDKETDVQERRLQDVLRVSLTALHAFLVGDNEVLSVALCDNVRLLLHDLEQLHLIRKNLCIAALDGNVKHTEVSNVPVTEALDEQELAQIKKHHMMKQQVMKSQNNSNKSNWNSNSPVKKRNERYNKKRNQGRRNQNPRGRNKSSASGPQAPAEKDSGSNQD